MQRARYIVLEGPIGVGKTSLASRLAEEFEARTLFENVEENPFLKEFYHDRKKNAFKAQLYFLLSRYQQQVDLVQTDLFQKTAVGDYLFAKDRIFAGLNLDRDELDLYDELYRILSPRIPRPDLVIYLSADIETLKKRIRGRAKPYERNLDTGYLSQVVSAYNDFFFHYDETPLLVISTTNIDFVSRDSDFQQLVKEIKEFRTGTQYFVPLGSTP
ncbi:MAG: deoxynucleoside kinase [Deltaproteobacteria bacterium]|nr:deoxynucleoside kinase [Candidatus Zymogenaceae bacterium]